MNTSAVPQNWARTGGALYLFVIVAALFGEMAARGTVITPGDAAATAAKLIESENLFRVGLAGEMLTCVADVVIAFVLYLLLRPVSRNLALLAAFFRLTFVSIYAVCKLFEIAALLVVEDAALLAAFEPAQRAALAYLALRLHGLGYGASLLFFGVHCVLAGYLLWRSTYLPRLLGALFVIAGAGYIAFSLAQLLAPGFAGRVLFPWLMLPALPAELGLALWLLICGVNAARWRAVTAPA